MKRALLILLVLLMPIQFGWAAVGAYCVDGQLDSQLDIHPAVHAQAADRSAADAADSHGPDAEPATCDLGCGHCHGHGLSLPATASAVVLQHATCLPAAEPQLPDQQLLAPRPERPQWFPLA